MLARLLHPRRIQAEPPERGVIAEPVEEEPPGFAVVALEATGLFARQDDRVVEIAIVSLDAAGRPVDEWTTLVNPLRDVGPVHVHGIKPSQVADAPTFPLIVGDVAERLADRILVAHDLRLVLAFLDAELAAAGHAVAWRPGISTMSLASGAGVSGRSIRAAASMLDLPAAAAHRALGDARTMAAVLRALIDRSGAGIAGHARPMPATALPQVPPSGRALTRDQGETILPRGLEALVDRVPVTGLVVDADMDAVLAYADLLDRILRYGRLTPDEVWELRRLASDWGMGTLAIEEIHRAYFGGLSRAAQEAAGSDAALTEDEWADVVALAEALCVPRVFWAEGVTPA